MYVIALASSVTAQNAAVATRDGNVNIRVADLKEVTIQHGSEIPTRVTTVEDIIIERSLTQSRIVDATDSIRSEIGTVNATIESLRSSLLDALANQEAPTCSSPRAPANGQVSIPPEFIPGTVARASCNENYRLVGNSDITCLQNGNLHGAFGTCQKIYYGSAERPAPNCRAVYDDYLADNNEGSLTDGPQVLAIGQFVGPVFCDFTRRTSDNARGWTLCGKYNRDHPAASRWLTQGFGRGFRQAWDMANKYDFSGAEKWSSLDCRPLFKNYTRYFMHYAEDTDGDNGTRYTNIMNDTLADPTNFFDYDRDDIGTCRSRNTVGIITYDANFRAITRDGPNSLSSGGCLYGDGHSFCTKNRLGARFSNAGTGTCTGSEADTIYWTWYGDDHGCAVGPAADGIKVIGTGCASNGLPTYRYNMLFIE